MSTTTFAPRPVARPVARQVARPARSTRSGGVRLTRRGRLVVLALACAVVGVVAVWLAAGSAATDAPGTAPAVEVVTVAPGETLWGIAGDAADELGIDVRQAMERIEQMNALDSGVLYAGQELRVPTS